MVLATQGGSPEVVKEGHLGVPHLQTYSILDLELYVCVFTPSSSRSFATARYEISAPYPVMQHLRPSMSLPLQSLFPM